MAILTTTPPTFNVNVPTPYATTTLVDSGRGATMTTSVPVKVVTAANGDKCIVSDVAFTATVSPDSAIINGYQIHGLCQDPWEPNETTQGFSQKASQAETAGSTSELFSYDPAKNKSPGANGGVPLSIAVGAKTTYVLGIGKTNLLSTDRRWQVLTNYVPFSIIDAIPAEGFIRPGVSSLTKQIRWRAGNLNMNVFPRLSYVSGARTIAQALSRIASSMQTLPLWGPLGGSDKYRRMTIDAGVSNGYAGDFSGPRAGDILALSWTDSDVDKLSLAVHVATWGSDMYEFALRCIANGNGIGGWGAGQWGGYVPALVTLGFMTGDSAVLAVAAQVRSNSLTQPFKVTEANHGARTMWPGPSDRIGHPYTKQDVGKADWIHSDPDPANRTNRMDSNVFARYRFGGSEGTIQPELLQIAMLKNGPGGITGVEWLDSIGKGYLIDYLDRMQSWGKASILNSAVDQYVFDIWTAVRPSFVYPVPVRAPEMATTGTITSTATGARVFFNGRDFSNQALTSRDFRYSIDGRSWVVVTGLANDQTVSSNIMLGQPHFGAARTVNATGPGDWSATVNGDALKASIIPNSFTPTTAGTAAIPVNSLLPSFVFRPYPMAEYRRFEPISGTPPAGVYRLYYALGYWFGGGKPDYFNYRLKRNGTLIESGQFNYTGIGGHLIGDFNAGYFDIKTAGHLGGTWTLEVDAVNGGGTTTATSAGITMHAAFDGKAYYVPPSSALSGTLPVELVEKWAFDTTAPKVSGGAYYSLLMGGSSSKPTAHRAWTWQSLPGIGSMSNVPEGDMVISSVAQDGVSATGQRIGFVICASGNAAAATGYIVECEWGTGDLTFRMTKVIAGVRQAVVSSAPVTTGVTGRSGSSRPSIFRVNWGMNASTMEIRVRCYTDPSMLQLREEAEVVEGASWDHTFTDSTSPYSTGECGIGYTVSKGNRYILGCGVSTSKAVPADYKAPVPTFTYS